MMLVLLLFMHLLIADYIYVQVLRYVYAYIHTLILIYIYMLKGLNYQIVQNLGTFNIDMKLSNLEM